jgi:hypothetical protein
MNPPRGQPTTTRSLKKSVRGLTGLMIRACTLVFEKTASCDSTGTSSALSTDLRYPLPGSYLSAVEPAASCSFSCAIASCGCRVAYATAGALVSSKKVSGSCPPAPSLVAATAIQMTPAVVAANVTGVITKRRTKKICPV